MSETYNPRYFRLRYAKGFAKEHIDLIAVGYAEWKDIVTSAISDWTARGIRGTQPPEYVFGELQLSDDRTVITIEISGNPNSYGALKLFEDGVPRRLFRNLPLEVQQQLEMSYENLAMNHPARWLPVDYRS